MDLEHTSPGKDDPMAQETSMGESAEKNQVNEVKEEQELESELEDIRQLDSAIVGMTENILVCKEHLAKVSHTARETDALLERWSALFSQMQHTQSLLLDTRWQGKSQDEQDEAQEQVEIAAAARVRESVRAKEAGRLKELEKSMAPRGETGEGGMMHGKRKRPENPSPPTKDKSTIPSSSSSSRKGNASKTSTIRSLRPPTIQVRQTTGLGARKKR
ncbi:MAG: DASH complex subunit Duo1-domain-containing protein [Piptocephalis tieghemiana]|nr:MAG: DASH complex subunit Duo1-domain-containing protein [Piptocephalis tieghemiana]